jgi:hypothetical protein
MIPIDAAVFLRAWRLRSEGPQLRPLLDFSGASAVHTKRIPEKLASPSDDLFLTSDYARFPRRSLPRRGVA